MEALVDRNLNQNKYVHHVTSSTNTYLGKLNVVLVELLFHDLLEDFQNEDLGFCESHLL